MHPSQKGWFVPPRTKHSPTLHCIVPPPTPAIPHSSRLGPCPNEEHAHPNEQTLARVRAQPRGEQRTVHYKVRAAHDKANPPVISRRLCESMRKDIPAGEQRQLGMHSYSYTAEYTSREGAITSNYIPSMLPYRRMRMSSLRAPPS